MASVLTDFTKKREFLVCMDSDGCVMDTVSIKHTIVMCPELIRVFALDDHRRGRRSTCATSHGAFPALRAWCWCLTG